MQFGLLHEQPSSTLSGLEPALPMAANTKKNTAAGRRGRVTDQNQRPAASPRQRADSHRRHGRISATTFMESSRHRLQALPSPRHRTSVGLRSTIARGSFQLAHSPMRVTHKSRRAQICVREGRRQSQRRDAVGNSEFWRRRITFNEPQLPLRRDLDWFRRCSRKDCSGRSESSCTIRLITASRDAL